MLPQLQSVSNYNSKHLRWLFRTVDQTVNWLIHNVELPQYEPNFRRHAVDGAKVSLSNSSAVYLCFKRLVPVEGRCWREVSVLVSPRSSCQKNSCQAPSRLTSSCQNVPISCHCKEKAILILPRELMAGPKSKIYLGEELLAGQTSKFFLAKVSPGPVWPRQFLPNGVSG